VQISLEGVADACGIVSLSSTRNAMSALRRSGWIEAEHVKDTARKGLRYRPTMPRHCKREERVEQETTSAGGEIC